jgi:integrase/recombinase XerC/integrase/recombinase XerD
MPRIKEDIFQPVTIRNTAMAEHIAAFTRYHLKRYAKETAKTYEKALSSFLSFILEDRNFKFRLDDIERYKVYLDTKKQHSPATISTYLTALRRFCQYLVECKELPRNPAKRIKGMSNANHAPIFLSHDELSALFHVDEQSSIQSLRDSLMMHLLLNCFLTEHELQSIVMGDCLLEGDSPAVRIGQSHTKVLPQSTLNVLELYVNIRFEGKDYQSEMPLFISLSNRTKGNSMSIRGIRDAIHQSIIRAPIDEIRKKLISPYAIRHTGGCLLAIMGYTEEEIMHKMRLKWKSSAQQYIRLKEQAINAGLEHGVHLMR